jgi:hypothetical protein
VASTLPSRPLNVTVYVRPCSGAISSAIAFRETSSFFKVTPLEE